jgi:hypothetical protein
MKAVTLCLVGFLAVSGTGFSQAEPAPAAKPAATPAPRGPVDLNTAEIPALEAVPEIGTDLANAVVSGRPYKSVEDAARVLKLSPEKLAALRPKVTVSPPRAAVTTPPNSGQQASAPAKSPVKKVNEGKATSAQAVTDRYDRAQEKAAAPQK